MLKETRVIPAAPILLNNERRIVMTTKQSEFIKTIGLLARNEYLSREKWILPSVCIAQAALESGWNLQAKTLFGIKGKGFTASTTEYYNGHKVQIQDSFRSYPNVASAVVGYYDFLANTPRYKNAINNTDPNKAVYYLIHTTDGAPYATDPNYIQKITSIISKYSLTAYDSREGSVAPVSGTRKTINQLAQEVLEGKWGNGDARKNNLINAGYDYLAVQTKVNQMLRAGAHNNQKSVEELAREVIKGRWGNGVQRKQKLQAAGYDYVAVQNAVNRLLKR